jgi:RNA polymerase sigma-70 factor (ECF subfamily)
MSGLTLDVGRFRDGDPAYFREVIHAYGDIVFPVVLRFTTDADEVDDLIQEVWVRVFQYRELYSARSPFEGWLHKVALNRCRTKARQWGAFQRLLARLGSMAVLGAIPWASPDPLDELIVQEQNAQLADAMEQLTDRELEAVRLCYLEGWKPRKAAKLMGIEAATVRSLLRNALEKLRVWVRGGGYDVS